MTTTTTLRARRGLIALVIAATAFPAASSTAAQRVAIGPHVPGEALVRFTPAASAGDRQAALASIDAWIVRSLDEVGFHLVRFAGPVDRAVARLRSARGVDVAEANVTGTIAISSNDPCIHGCGSGRQWNLGAVNAEAGWDVVPGRFYTAATKKTDALPAVKVAVLDTKIEVRHPDWINASPPPVNHPWSTAHGGQLDLVNARDILPGSRQSGSADYHGTFVAGILGASANNGAGIAGLGYRAEIVPITVVDGSGVVTAADLSAGIVHAKNIGARVINLSLGLRQTSTAVQDAVDLATKAGSLVIAAAGNDASAAPFYPAWHRDVMSVAGVDEADRRAPCSNFGPETDVAAPGTGIISMDPRTGTGYSVAGCGTSTAAPHVSALAALLFAQDPGRTPAQVREIILRSADDDRFTEGRDDRFGHGRINFERALRYGQGPTVDRVIATIPRALGGTSTYQATATATAAKPIRQAEWFLGSLGAPGTGSVVHAADGSFGGLSEALTVNVEIPLGFPSGIHRLFIRARDDGGWGAASVGVLIVDRTPPKILSLDVAPAAAAIAGQPVAITIEASDDHSTQLTYSFTVRNVLTDAVIFESEESTMSEVATTEWLPSPGTIGMFDIDVTVRDEGWNPATAEARTIVV